jgi:signal transduction histidine kinase
MTAARSWTTDDEPDRPPPRGRARERPPVATGEAARFLAEASHELRGGAARLALMAEALAEQAGPVPDPRLEPRLQSLASEGRRVQALASALLDVVRLAEEGRRLDTVPVPVAAVLDRVLAGEVPRAGQVVDVRLADDLTVLADPLALDQILSNLVRNAYQHGGDHVRIEGGADGDHIAVAVTDDGPGVDARRQARLFTPFPRRHVGDGLGLSIAAQLVALLEGELSYEPGDRAGARFTLRLPGAP